MLVIVAMRYTPHKLVQKSARASQPRKSAIIFIPGSAIHGACT